jgi:hypothetical protein
MPVEEVNMGVVVLKRAISILTILGRAPMLSYKVIERFA